MICPTCHRDGYHPEAFSIKLTPAQLERFMSYITQKENGCWIYRTWGEKYGRFNVNSATYTASRVAYAHFIGPIPDGLKVCHNCPDGDDTGCVNPYHMKLGTQQENVGDMMKKGRHKPQIGSKHAKSKTDEETVLKIRTTIADGTETVDSWSVKLNMSFQGVYRIATGISWKHVGGPLLKKRLDRKEHSKEDVLEWRRLYAQGVTQTEIAKRFGVKQSTVSYYVRGKQRQDVEMPGGIENEGPRIRKAA